MSNLQTQQITEVIGLMSTIMTVGLVAFMVKLLLKPMLSLRASPSHQPPASRLTQEGRDSIPPISDDEDELAIRGAMLMLKRASMLAKTYSSAYSHKAPQEDVTQLIRLHDQIEEVYSRVPIHHANTNSNMPQVSRPAVNRVPIDHMLDHMLPWISNLEAAIASNDRYAIMDLSSYLSEWPIIFKETGIVGESYFGKIEVVYRIAIPILGIYAPEEDQYADRGTIREHKIIGLMHSVRMYTEGLGETVSALTRLMEHRRSILPREPAFFTTLEALESGRPELMLPKDVEEELLMHLSLAYHELHWLNAGARELGYYVDIPFLKAVFDRIRGYIEGAAMGKDESKEALLKGVLFLLENTTLSR